MTKITKVLACGVTNIIYNIHMLIHKYVYKKVIITFHIQFGYSEELDHLQLTISLTANSFFDLTYKWEQMS